MFETGFYVWTLIKTALRFKEITPPSTGQMGPNTVALYAKDKAGVSNLYFKNDAGTEFDLSSGASGAPNSADYLVKTADAGLTAERVVTDTASITVDWATAGQAKFQREALTGDVTASQNSNATTIANDAVTTVKILDTAVTNAKLADMAAWTYKVRNAGTSGVPSDAALADFTTVVPSSGDYAVGFLSTGELRKFDVGNFGSASSGGGHLHGLMRVLSDGTTTVWNLLDLAEYVERITDAGSELDPSGYSLSSDRSQVTLSAAPTAANVLVFEYVIAGI